MTHLGPVSAVLEADVRTWVRRHGVVVWLDLDDHYGAFVDQLAEARAAGQLGYEVRAFRGSYLDLMRSLEDLTSGAEPPSLLVHLPGFNEDAVKTTPLYELYRAGVRYRKSLDTLVTEAATGRAKPAEIAAVVARQGLTLEGADGWLSAALDDQEGGLAAQLRAISACALLDDLLGDGFIASRLGVPATEHAVWEHLATSLALPESWQGLLLGPRRPGASRRPDEVATVITSWVLSVEYVGDLRRAPVAACLVGIDELPKGVREACGELAAHVRARHPDYYRRTADEMEQALAEERDIAKAADLGRIDTFRFEEAKVLEAAVDALGEGEWGVAAEYADVRVDGESFWIRRDPSRQSAWQLVEAAARLGLAVAQAGARLEAKDHAEALARYVGGGAAVDRAHRELEQARAKLLSPQLPEFERIRAQLDAVREVWRTWADAWAVDFNRLCMEEGFLPPAELQQRTLFEDVVRPQTQPEGATAFFVVDALRYEMGDALYQVIVPTRTTTTQLAGRFAELPSNTEVGMNVLAPVADQGKLRPAIGSGRIKGFATGEFRVSDPDTRRRAMFDRVGGGTCPWLSLAEVLERDAQKLKATVAQAKLVVIHSQEIDKAGEAGGGLNAFEPTLQQLASAWRLLRQAGVRRFVFTSDHGFLLLEGPTTELQAHGRKVDPSRRHVFSPLEANHTGEARVALAALGYEGVEGHLMFPLTTAPFDTRKRRRNFVHGGNSLQERVIPVLTVVHRAASGGSTLRYRVRAEAREAVGGMHCLKAQVDAVAGQGSLDFGGVKELELALRVADLDDVAVTLCQTRGGARLVHGALNATVGQEFELFFQLSGRTDARALVVLHHPSRALDVEEGGPEQRFAVAASAIASTSEVEEDTDATVTGSQKPSAPPVTRSSPPGAWLSKLPDGVREVFAHIEAHGACVENEAAKKLGGGRALRKFSRDFEKYAALAPFEACIVVVDGVKRYVKKGAAS